MPVRFRVLPFLFVFVSFLAAEAFAAQITGTVNDPDGRPIKDARVLVKTPLGVLSTRETDSSGAFQIDGIAAGAYELLVSANGFRADPLSLTVSSDERRSVMFTLTLAAVTESVVVSAAQIDQPLSRAPGSVTVLDRAGLQARQIDTLSDALALVPGVTVARSGTRGALTSVFGRGGESDYTLVLVDGVRANLFGGTFDFSELPSLGIERIEVVRGPQSALFGSDAIAGVVQIITRRDGPLLVEGRSDAGGLGTRQAGVSASGTHHGFGWGGAAEGVRSEGFRGLAVANGERVSNDDYSRRDLSGRAGWQNQAGLEFAGNIRGSHANRGLPGPYGSDPNLTFPGVDRSTRQITDRIQVGARESHFWPGAARRVRQRTQVAWGDFNFHYKSQYPSGSESENLSVRSQTDILASAHATLSAGLEYQREQATSTYIVGLGGTPLPVHRDVIGYFGELRLETPQALTASVGLRIEQIRRRTLAGDSSAGRPAFAAESVVSPNPKASIGWLVRPASSATAVGTTRVHASAGTGIRAPDAFEIAFTDNPSLKPERTGSVEGGLAQEFAGALLRVDATAFVNRYDDLIVAVRPVSRGASQYRTDNISNARARGFELGFSSRIRGGVRALLSYTFLDTEILQDDGDDGNIPEPFKPGDALIRRPKHQAAADITLVHNRVSAYARVGARGRVLDIDPSYGTFGGSLIAPGFVATHAGAAVRLAPHIEMYGHVTNLFARRYEEAIGFPAPPRTATIGVRVAAGR